MSRSHDFSRPRRGLTSFLISLLGALCLLGLARPSAAASYTVTNTNDSGSGSLRDAIAQAAGDSDPSDTISFDSTVTGTITLRTGQLSIAKNLTITGPGQTLLTISGGNSSRIFEITAGSVSISGLTVSGGHITGTTTQPAYGAGIDVEGFSNLTLADCTVTGNTATHASGGGIALNVGPDVLTNCTIAGNTASSFSNLGGQGGGVYVNVFASGNYVAANFQNCTISGNAATGGSGTGGGLYAAYAVSLTNSTISGNTATVSGGGITDAAQVSLTSCTVAANTVTSSTGQGGGILNSGSNTTIAAQSYPALALQGALIASNQSAHSPDLACPTTVAGTSQGSNLIGDGTGSKGFINGVSHDQVGTAAAPIAAKLGTLQTNEGTTKTMALLPGSPAIDADYTGNAPATDQRGIARPQGIRPDIGAYEVYQARALIVTNNNDSGIGSLRQALTLANGDLGDTITFDPTVAGTITLTSGELAVNHSMTITGPGAAALTISGGQASRVLHMTGGTVTLSGLTLAAGSTVASGGGILAEGGALSVVGCILSGNTSGNGSGGGISAGAAASLIVTNCSFTGNAAQFGGGGIDGEGQVTVLDCTFSGNSVPSGGGGLFVAGSATVINSTFTGNTANEGAGILCHGTLGLRSCTLSGNVLINSGVGGGLGVSSGGQVAVTGCIIAGNIAGTGGSDPDVEEGSGGTIVTDGSNLIGDGTGAAAFVNGAENDQVGTPAIPLNPKLGPLQNNGGPTLTLALLPGSPAIDANYTTGGSATDQRGFIRPEGARADIGAYEYSSTPIHILWNSTDGTASVWNYAASGGSYTFHNYGPYPGWTAVALADGPDGQTRMLWDNTDGRASIWSLNNATGVFTFHNFGPYAGWAAAGISVGSEDTTHVLWNKTDGTISLWNYSPDGGTFIYRNYGPYDGWSARAIADGPDGNTRILWNNTDGRMSLDSYTLTTGNYTVNTFGPFLNWTAVALSVAADNTAHILWDNFDDTASIWNFTVVNGVGGFTFHDYGPYDGWSAVALSDAPDGLTRVLWDNGDGRMSLWKLDNNTAIFSQFTYGPFTGYTADALSQGR